MDFNLTSKNNIGIVGTLILAIFLSQNRTMDFMFRTALGRLTLIILILAMSYTNKILGVAGVLFVVIIFSSSKINFMEGATGSMDPAVPVVPAVPGDTAADPAVPTVPANLENPPDDPTADLAADPAVPVVADPPADPPTVAPKKKGSSAIGSSIDETQKSVTEDITTENTGDAINSTENAGVESFDIIGLERNIQKGKNSNSIPIHNNNNSNNILPTDFGTGFNIGFSIF
jgi:hypothetical protein